MPVNEVFIKYNGTFEDAFVRYGLSFEEEGLSRLMTPAPHKEPVQNKNLAMHGTSIAGNVNYKDVRTLSIPFHITAPDKATFFQRYWRFCQEVLDTGWVHLKHAALTDKVFHFRYVDCQQFSQFNREMAKFTLSLEEPNPNNRT